MDNKKSARKKIQSKNQTTNKKPKKQTDTKVKKSLLRQKQNNKGGFMNRLFNPGEQEAVILNNHLNTSQHIMNRNQGRSSINITLEHFIEITKIFNQHRDKILQNYKIHNILYSNRIQHNIKDILILIIEIKRDPELFKIQKLQIDYDKFVYKNKFDTIQLFSNGTYSFTVGHVLQLANLYKRHYQILHNRPWIDQLINDILDKIENLQSFNVVNNIIKLVIQIKRDPELFKIEQLQIDYDNFVYDNKFNIIQLFTDGTNIFTVGHALQLANLYGKHYTSLYQNSVLTNKINDLLYIVENIGSISTIMTFLTPSKIDQKIQTIIMEITFKDASLVSNESLQNDFKSFIMQFKHLTIATIRQGAGNKKRTKKSS